MKTALQIIIPVLGIIGFLSSCNTNKVQEGTLPDFSQDFPLEVKTENSLLASWAKKEVLSSKLIDDMEGNVEWKKGESIATLEYTTERFVDGKKSLRYRTSMRDTNHIKRPENRSEWGSFGGQQGGDSSFGITFDEPQDWTDYNRISIWVYIHPTKTPIHHFFLDVVNKDTDYNTITPRHDAVIQDLTAGEWHNVVWEITDMPRDKVYKFNIFQTLIGYEPGNDEYETFDFDRLELQKVEADHNDGWDIPQDQFAYAHIGYRPNDVKQALASAGDQTQFQLLDQKNQVVYTGTAQQIKNENGTFTQMDFTEFNTPGVYCLKYGSAISNPFPINEYVWFEPMFSGLNFYFCQRCGYEVSGIHGVCHQDWQAFHNDEVKVINGGWHDAGDMSQGYFRTAIGSFVLLRNLALVKDDPQFAELAAKLKDEALWGLKWVTKNHFKEGYHMSWGRQRIYSDNIIGTIDDVMIKTVNSPWENFLGAAVLTLANKYFTEADVESGFLNEMEEVTFDNWEQAYNSKERWDVASYMEASWGAIASTLLYQKTNNEKYKKAAMLFGELLIQCQEVEFKQGIPITGYFYTNQTRQKIVQNNHGSNDEAPLLALRTLCEAFPESQDWMRWYSSAAIYSDYFMKRGSEIAAPYYLVPNAVYRKSDIEAIQNERTRSFSLIQFNEGTPLNEEYTLRTFPIWSGDLFHGGTSCHLASSWALAEASQLRNDTEGLNLVGKQLEWTFGLNPFGQTLMYGVGYNFTPQFAYCTKNVVGSLAVGMDCMRDDQPHWNGSAYATCKEMWIASVNRFMGAVATYSENQMRSQENDITISFDKELVRDTTQEAVITLTGEGRHTLDIRFQNATSDFQSQEVVLVKGQKKQIKVAILLVDSTKPYVAVAIVDGDTQNVQDISGAAL